MTPSQETAFVAKTSSLNITNNKEHPNRNIWVDYLRSALTVLVVAHHSSLAYTTFAAFDAEVYIRSTHPIVDPKRWVGLDIFENFNDIFFMSLMFLVGGLFLSRSIVKKGTTSFIKDRFNRLFIPFLFLGTLLMLVAYLPSYYTAHYSWNVIAYIKDFFTTEQWPVGPPWFIWVLFAFNVLFAVSNLIFSNLYKKIGEEISRLDDKPLLFFVVLFAITWILYVPLAYQIGAGTWTGMGPFDFQLSRILLYFGYFMIGVWIGNSDFNNGLFSQKTRLVRSWKLWIALSLILYFVLVLIGAMKFLENLVLTNKMKEFTAWMIYYSFYAASCTASSIAFLTTFRYLFRAKQSWWHSLSENAYLIYLIHFVFVIWIQFMLTNTDLHAFIKFALTFVLSLILSWGSSLLLRKFKLIKKYL
jgi:glucans biosynthesis protein C